MFPPAATSAHSHLSVADLHCRLQAITVPLSAPDARFTNWGQTFTCRPLAVFRPESVEQCELIFELARREGKTLRVAGVGHSPSDLACTNGYMLRTEKLNRILEVNHDKAYVVAEGGITLHDLHAGLAANDLCMINCGSISDQTLGGVITTATHGSGINFGVLSTHVVGLSILLPNGSHVRCSREENSDLFMASVCGIGCTGLILSIKLRVEPAFRLKEHQETVPFEQAVTTMDAIVNSAEHVRLWWFPQADAVRVSCADRTAEPRNPAGSWLWGSLCGFHVVQFLLFCGRFFPAVNTWTARFASWLISDKSVGVDVSWRIFNVDCRYPQYTTEWAIPYANTQACLRELRRMFDDELADPHGLRPHFPIEIRFSAADDIWLSPSSGQPACWIGIVQYKPYGLVVPYRKLFERFEAILGRHAGRPHWAKAHPLGPDDLRRLYPRFDDFVRVLELADPLGMLRNPYVERHLFGRSGPAVHGRVFKPAQ